MSARFIMTLEHEAAKMSEQAAAYQMAGERRLAASAQFAVRAIHSTIAAMTAHEELYRDVFSLKDEC